ncbi:MAG: aldose epimerase family protein [Bacteroidales bacterium]|nr:aldose epimerase family protein [Bacteroidales bacterium]
MKQLKPQQILVLAAIVLFTGCKQEVNKQYIMKREDFGEIDGKKVELITLANTHGNTIKLTNYGATLVWVEVPDRDGNKENITFGYETLDAYLNGDPYFGSVVGRYANRIAGGKFTLDSVEYQLAINNPPNTLHGGPGGWHSVVWETEIIEKEGEEPAVKFTYLSPDMEEGYPGEVRAEAKYTWTDENELVIEYRCSTDKKTVLNITNHAYFNLHGAGNGDILDHELMIAAGKFTPVDENLIPTGELRPVEGTPFDFTTPHVIGDRIEDDYEQLRLGLGYDHNFVLDNTTEPDAVVYEPGSGRLIEMNTDQPGVQFYCGNFLNGLEKGHGGKVYEYRSGLCLETQHFPDSPNQADFPSAVLEPGKPFTSKTVYKFSVR